MYSLHELSSIIQNEGLEKTLTEISPEMIKDPTFRDIWDEARTALERVTEYLDDVADIDDDDLLEDAIFDEDDDESYD